MASIKYRFNPETLSYERIEKKLKKRIIEFLVSKAATTLLFTAIFFLIFVTVIHSPDERRLRDKNRQLQLKFHLLQKSFSHTQKILTDLQNRDDNIYRSIFEAKPIPYSIRKAGFGGTDKYLKYKGSGVSDVVIQSARQLDQITKQIYIQSKSFDDVVEMIKNKERMLASIPAIQPVANKHLTGFCPFGMRQHPILDIYRLHAGVDLCARQGTEIYAAGDGTVIRAKLGKGVGYYVMIDHGYGYKTLYGHVSKMLVRAGQKVKRGDVIALVGTTGVSLTPHLHYEVHKNGKQVDPVNFYLNDLSEEEYNRMIEISSSAPFEHF